MLLAMHIQFQVNGHYDWEKAELHPGVQITPADVKALRAKQDAEGRWLIRVEKKRDTHHDANIPELSICEFVVWQAVHAGNEWSRHDAIVELMKHSYKHHGRQDHIEEVHTQDSGPHPELIDSEVARCMAEYSDQLDAEALEAAGVKVDWQKDETWQTALARAKETDAGREALATGVIRREQTLAGAQRSADAAKARYLAGGVNVHSHVRAHFGSHLKQGA